MYIDGVRIPVQVMKPAGGYLGYLLQQQNIELNPVLIKVNFLGLFDTVSSYSPTLLPNFKNDIGELKLDNIGKARHVVHFTAQDEIRQYFALTPTQKGIARAFPGVHSDIGGSYHTGDERVIAIYKPSTKDKELRELRNELIEEGWYKQEGELTLENRLYWSLDGYKKKVYKEYSFIPLHFMLEYSLDHKVPIDEEKVYEKYSIDEHPLLHSVKQTLTNYIRGGGAYPYGGSELTTERLEELKGLRYSYLHRSANYSDTSSKPEPSGKRYELKP